MNKLMTEEEVDALLKAVKDMETPEPTKVLVKGMSLHGSMVSLNRVEYHNGEQTFEVVDTCKDGFMISRGVFDEFEGANARFNMLTNS
jgi:hypothetical protein